MRAMRTAFLAVALLLAVTPLAQAQPGVLTTEQLIEHTPDWKGSASLMAVPRCRMRSSIA